MWSRRRFPRSSGWRDRRRHRLDRCARTATLGPSGGPGGSTTTTVEVGSAGEPGATTTTLAGSGIGGGGTPSGGADGIADTGHESMLGAGIALAAVGLLLRRLRPTAS